MLINKKNVQLGFYGGFRFFYGEWGIGMWQSEIRNGEILYVISKKFTPFMGW